MDTDQLEALGAGVARTLKDRYMLDYIRFDAGTAALEQPTPWATLFIAKRGYVSHRHHEFPSAEVQTWLTLPESQVHDTFFKALESRAMELIKETVDGKPGESTNLEPKEDPAAHTSGRVNVPQGDSSRSASTLGAALVAACLIVFLVWMSSKGLRSQQQS